MPTATCHCGTIRLDTPPLPDEVACCGCSICRRYGALWAYYPVGTVQVHAPDDSMDTYVWGDHTLAFVRCRRCGCVTHWQPLQADGGERLGVNARNFDPAQLESVNIRWLDPDDS